MANDFLIPSNPNELLNEVTDYYSVKNVLSKQEIIHNLKAVKNSLQKDGTDFILINFDYYYSIITQTDQISFDIVFNSYLDLHKALVEFNQTLGLILDDKDNLDDESKRITSNKLKMLIYIYTQFIIWLEQKKQSEDSSNLIVKRKKSAPKDNPSNTVNKCNVLLLLHNIIQREVNVLFEPPIVEDSLVNLVSEVCYIYLQNNEIKTKKDLRLEIFSLIDCLIKQCNHGTTFIIRIVQLIKIHEHLAQCLPDAIQYLVEKNNSKGLLHNLIREITEWQQEEMQDNQGSKNCSNILVDLAKLMPDLMCAEMDFLDQYLNNDPVPLRSAVISIISELILHISSKETLTQDDQQLCNLYLDDLICFIKDRSAVIRGKIIQIFGKLQKTIILPLKYFIKILEEIIAHLYDKSALVRRYAITTITTFLTHNTFGSNLQLKIIQKEFNEKSDLLNSIKSKYQKNITELEKEIETTWENHKNGLKQVIEEHLNNRNSDNEEENDDNEEDILDLAKDKLFQKICQLINDKNYKDAFKLHQEAINEIEEWDEMRNQSESEVDMYLISFKFIYSNVTTLAQECNYIGMDEDTLKQVQQLENETTCLKDTITFLELIDKTIKPMTALLETPFIGDMQEAIQFFITAFQFQLHNATEGILAMLNLMKRNEQDRKNAVIEAFKTIYLNTNCNNMNDHATTIIKRLGQLIETITTEHYHSLVEIISEWTNKHILDNNIIDMCWQYYTKRIDCTDKLSCIAAEILYMAANGRKTIITKNIKLVATLAFGERGLNDITFFNKSCLLLSSAQTRIDMDSKNLPNFLSVDDEIFQNLLNILVVQFFVANNNYSEALTNAINAVYALCAKPEKFCEDLLSKIVNKLYDDNIVEDIDEERPIAMYILMRSCQLLGLISIKQLEFLDDSIYKELKRRNNIRTERKEMKQKDNKKNNKKALINRSFLLPRAANDIPIINNNENNDESTLEGAQAEDADAEFILNVLENDTVNGSSVLNKLFYIIQNICERPHIYNNEKLQGIAVVALIRYMLVSSKFCIQNMKLLFTILEKTEFDDVKITIVYHCRDLLTRFPNIVEPWTPRIYQKLQDSNVQVRKATFFTLSYLILRDMVRAHSHISEMILSIVDECEEIKEMCKTFFVQLSHKENNLFHVLPDIFSHLTKSDKIDDSEVKRIMKFLFDLIDKAKQMENLVDRFCYKFELSNNVEECRNIAYCLSLIQYNDKALRKLQDNWLLYKNHLSDSDVYVHFKQILADCSKQQVGKTNLKPIVDEIEENIKMQLEENVENNNEDGNTTATTVKSTISKNNKRNAKKNNKRSTKKQKVQSSDDQKEDDDDFVDNSKRRMKQRNRKHKRAVIEENSSSSD